jgi:molecular chaperone GrpE (heat shock protein)
MNEEFLPGPTRPEAGEGRPQPALGGSTLLSLCREMITLREMNHRQHKLFEQSLAKSRDALQSTFNSFAADTQRAYQQLRQEIHGEKRVSLALLNELLDLALDLRQVVAARPPAEDAEACGRWADAVEVAERKVQDALRRHGIQVYDAVIGSAYNPALHERVGGVRKEGMGPLLVAEQREPGFASQQPGFVLRRPKVVVTE